MPFLGKIIFHYTFVPGYLLYLYDDGTVPTSLLRPTYRKVVFNPGFMLKSPLETFKYRFAD